MARIYSNENIPIQVVTELRRLGQGHAVALTSALIRSRRRQFLMSADEKFVPPKGYSDAFDHHRNFIGAVRSRKPVVEDAVFGFRAAGPALLSNISYFDKKVCLWDPEGMTLTS